jgi:uncharacterized iron-regulated membrane protein
MRKGASKKGSDPFFGTGSAWARQPQRVPFRGVLMKIHRWLALAVGIYLIVISISGSAVVFRPEINRWAVPRVVPDASGEPVRGEALTAALETAYPDDQILSFTESRFRRGPVSVLLSRDGKEEGRLFDAYALEDMGSNYPPVVRLVEWLVSLHDDLLASQVGRKLNGIGGALALVIVLSGIILWWPGKRSWQRSLYVPRRSARVLWHLHSALGLWLCLLLVNWALTSLYLSFPGPFEDLRDWLDADMTDFTRPGDRLIPFLLDAHFGRFGGLFGRTTWVVLGLSPVVLLVTGVWVWWRGRKASV